MKKIFSILFIVVVAAMAARAQGRGEELAQQADSAYTADNFQLAEKLYNQALAEGGSSTTLFYNLGNTYYREGNLGMAVVSYERALKLDPTNSDAETNLEFVKGKLTDKQIDSGSVMTTLWHNLVGLYHTDTWAWIGIGLFALFLAGVFTYLFSNAVLVKKISFFGGGVVFLLCAFCIMMSFASANRLSNNDSAVIISPAAQLSTSPREARTQAEEAFLLHEGTRVEIVDSVAGTSEGKWYEVKVGNRDRAWVKAADLVRI